MREDFVSFPSFVKLIGGEIRSAQKGTQLFPELRLHGSQGDVSIVFCPVIIVERKSQRGKIVIFATLSLSEEMARGPHIEDIHERVENGYIHVLPLTGSLDFEQGG